LDSNTSVEVMNLMKKVVREKNQTLVMVTHDNYLAGFADIVLRIKDGKIIEIEDRRGEDMPEEISANENTIRTEEPSA
ncbi:MAG: ABC transporter ATP-binding protein, partial [Lachnospiraceae bacterium]|nr:ABC transporter ATP-binding protein [Lachnospiraceae bacterium]